MMTAMMAFFLLMWLLGASNADQRKSIADYFKPTSHSNVTMGKLAGSDGMLGGRSVIDPRWLSLFRQADQLTEHGDAAFTGRPN